MGCRLGKEKSHFVSLYSLPGYNLCRECFERIDQDTDNTVDEMLSIKTKDLGKSFIITEIDELPYPQYGLYGNSYTKLLSTGNNTFDIQIFKFNRYVEAILQEVLPRKFGDYSPTTETFINLGRYAILIKMGFSDDIIYFTDNLYYVSIILEQLKNGLNWNTIN